MTKLRQALLAAQTESRLRRLCSEFCAGLIIALALVGSSAAAIEEAPGYVRVSTNGYIIYASAVRAGTLPEESLERHDLSPADHAVLLNVTVMKGDRHIEAQVHARAVNLAQQVEEGHVRETRANDFLSYTCVFDVAPTEVLRFEIRVIPKGAEEPIDIEFQEPFGLGHP
ncbi:MAG TPA: DUF4426 domain-containing protein [Woeseiaceae bacterium]|nr:DUF4426 domain-containing protein [Woeseiaceae bacterium]